MTDVLIDARRGAGSSLEILYGTVTWKPTLTHSRGTSIVLPAPTTYDLVDGQVVATNVQPTPAPVEGQVEWAYEVTFKDRHSKSYSFLVGVPDSTTQVNFIDLPRYFETKPPLFGQGPQGIPGEVATVAVGTVAEGTEASVTNSGTNTDAVLDFVLPEGPQGPPGDGFVYLSTPPQFTDPSSTYPVGSSYFTLSNPGTTGWERGYLTGVTVRRNNGRTVQTITYNDGRQFSRVDGGPESAWLPLKENAWSDLATTTANGLMSSGDKSKLDNVGTLAYASKMPSDAPSSYPEGTTVGLQRVTDGWPSMEEGTSSVNVRTERPKGYDSAIQWASKNNTADSSLGSPSPVLFREGATTGGWGEWQTLATTGGVEGLITESRSNSYVIDIADFGAERDGPDASAAIMAANAVALAESKTIVASGTYYIRSKVIVTANCDFTTANFLCDLPGVAIEVTSVRKKHLFGNIDNMRKTAGGWSSVAGSKGLVVRNCNTSTIGYQFIRNFEHGLTIYGDNGGSAYNTIHCGALWHNKVNLVLETTSSTGTGYSNQNTFIGGRFAHVTSDSGANAVGVKQVWFRGGISDDDGGRSNNNTFLGSSFEGIAPEYTVDFERASSNLMLNCRYEFGNAIRFGEVSRDNNMIGGFGLSEISKEIVPGAIRNRWSSPTEDVAYQIFDRKYSSQAHAYPWYETNWSNRSLAIGNGGTPPRKISAVTSTALQVDASWHPAEPNTYDLGSAANPWRNQFISTVRALDNFVIPIRTGHPPTPQSTGVSLYAILGSPNRVVAQFPDGTVKDL